MMAAGAAPTRQNMAPDLNHSHPDECDLSGEFDARCRISVHYASTPAMDNNGKREEELDSCKRIQSCSRFPSRNSFSIRRRSRLAERIINLCRQIEEDWSRNPRVRPPFRELRDSIIRCSRREGGRDGEREGGNCKDWKCIIHPRRRVDENCRGNRESILARRLG